MHLLVESLSKRFGSNAALHDVSFHIADNEFVAIVGPTGCGKTTLLNIVAGFERPTSGVITLTGRPLAGPGPDRVMIFQDSALFPCKTVGENVEFGLKQKGFDSSQRRLIASGALASVGLSGFIEHYPHQLSGGMRKLVEVVRATVLTDPAPLLLCDEALGQLDALTRAQTQDMVQRIWMTSPRTVLWVTHDLEEALYLSDRVLVFSARPGSITAELQVPFPRPRLPQLRTSSTLQALRNRLFELLCVPEAATS